jgi:hypothetical protein
MRRARDNTTTGHANIRDKVSNGRLLSQGVDLRKAPGRRFAHLVRSAIEEAGGEVTEAELNLIKQSVALQMQAERMQEAIARGEDIDPDQLIRVSSTSKRLLEAIGSKAKPPPTGQELLQAHLASKTEGNGNG